MRRSRRWGPQPSDDAPRAGAEVVWRPSAIGPPRRAAIRILVRRVSWYIERVRTRIWPAVALGLVACGGDRTPARTDRPALTKRQGPAIPTGPEALVIRIPRTGGAAQAYDYDRLDSAIWTSSEAMPAVNRVLAFDEDGGAIAFVDAKGAPRRVELRTGAITPPPDVKLTALRSADGASVYGVSTAGLVTRLTPTDTRPWTLRPPPPFGARDVAPQTDGSVVIVGDAAGVQKLWRVRPPGTKLLDTASLGHTFRLVRAAIGDRAYFASDSTLQAIRIRDLKPAPPIRFDHRLRTVAPTPSGDRLYIALDSVSALRVIDTYSGQNETVALPGAPGDLRMDSLGRYLLVRPARSVDSAWVVTVGTDRVIGSVPTTWSADLPFVGSDGSIVTAQGVDVVLLDPQSLKVRRTVSDGADDFWIPIRWSGFRPRAPGLDQPVTFPKTPVDSGDSILAAIRRSQHDTTLHPTSAPPPEPHPSVVDSAQGRLGTSPPRSPGFTVQLAALLSPDSARSRASRIVADGIHAHVIAAPRGGTTVYLVVLGPYQTRDAAEAAGRASQQPNPWVYEGVP
jgi:SPOR domain